MPPPPAFLTGPMAALLTNAQPFSARVVVETNSRSNPHGIRSGTLLGRGSKLLFAMDPAIPAKKGARASSFLFIWDVTESRGYVLSEALQGFAPIATNARCAALSFEPARAAPLKLDGHLCQRFDAIVKMDDGVVAGFRVWRATDLKGFPLRVSSANDPLVPELNFSRVRLEGLPADLFAPPNGFTKYESTQALMVELVARQRNLVFKAKGEEETVPAEPRSDRLYR